ncbi:hypothetical protein [Pseudoduganella violaceinigra]|uniref:hypothetical protein n=1 Tax=Pseudoduganella violaceinigra TaxID=246602 RepID=UPI000421A1F9|nr:hypothetical protein [Pseudoduganella violaceinigra]
MTPQQFVGTAVRLFAIFLVLTTMSMALFVYTSTRQGDLSPALFLVPFAYFSLAVFLWFFPMTVAHKLVPRTAHANTINLQAREMIIVGSVILGLWGMLGALPQLASLFVLVIGNEAALSYMDAGRKADFLGMLVRSLMGLFLVIRPSLVADLAGRRPD